MPNTNAESFEELRGKKLKVWSAATSRVLVVQDGNAADADATLQIDEGFRDGYGYGDDKCQSLNIDPEDDCDE